MILIPPLPDKGQPDNPGQAWSRREILRNSFCIFDQPIRSSDRSTSCLRQSCQPNPGRGDHNALIAVGQKLVTIAHFDELQGRDLQGLDQTGSPLFQIYVRSFAGRDLAHQGTGPSSSKNPPVGPSSGKVARRTGALAPCSTVRVPLN